MKENVRRFLALSELANHFPALHGVRVLGILSVLQFHVTVALSEARLLTDVDPGDSRDESVLVGRRPRKVA